MTDLLFRKGAKSLIPVDEAADIALSKIGMGDIVRVRGLTRPRNPQHHRLYWALLNMVVENSEMFEDAEQLHFMLKIATGHVREFVNHEGKVFYEPKPTDFASMGQDDFNAYFDKCIRVICTRVIPGMDDQALRAEALEMVS